MRRGIEQWMQECTKSFSRTLKPTFGRQKMTKPLYYNATQAAKLIGCDARTIIDMVKHDEIPGAIKVGRLYMIPRRWVEQGTEQAS
jgi:excisionase family DNA binding protein